MLYLNYHLTIDFRVGYYLSSVLTGYFCAFLYFYCRCISVGEFPADFTFILLSLLFIRSQRAGKGFVPRVSTWGNPGSGFVLQLWCLVTPTLVLVLALCFWASGEYSVPSGHKKSLDLQQGVSHFNFIFRG